MTLAELLIVLGAMAVPTFLVLGLIVLSRRRRASGSNAPAGWYADPDRSNGWRWSDGTSWTEMTDRDHAAPEGVES